MIKLTIIGDSHGQFLGSFIRQEKLPIHIRYCAADKLLKPFAVSNGDGTIAWSDPSVGERYKTPLSNEPWLVVCISAGGILSLLAKDEMWRSHAPWRVAQKYNLQPMSDGLTRKIILTPLMASLQFIDLLLENGFDVIAMEPPPLKRTHPGILEGTNPEVLLAVDTEWRLAFRNEVTRRQIGLVTPPPETVDSDGFLKEAYSFNGADDPHHANSEYAALIVPNCLQVANAQIARKLASTDLVTTSEGH